MSDWNLILIQGLLLALQIGCGLYASAKRKNIMEVLYGFGVWGCFPIIGIMLVVLFN